MSLGHLPDKFVLPAPPLTTDAVAVGVEKKFQARFLGEQLDEVLAHTGVAAGVYLGMSLGPLMFRLDIGQKCQPEGVGRSGPRSPGDNATSGFRQGMAREGGHGEPKQGVVER